MLERLRLLKLSLCFTYGYVSISKESKQIFAITDGIPTLMICFCQFKTNIDHHFVCVILHLSNSFDIRIDKKRI